MFGLIFYDRHWDTITRRLAGSIAGDISNVLLQMQCQPDLTETILLQAKATMDLDMTLLPDAILPNAENHLLAGLIALYPAPQIIALIFPIALIPKALKKGL